MGLKTFKPYTKSNRGTVIIDKNSLWKGSPYKPLTRGKKSTAGRNNYGRITSRSKGAGHKNKFRIIDFDRKDFRKFGRVSDCRSEFGYTKCR